ncbi:hypothetical protein KC323_g6691 [Hortaea werneckii]|nr:hypothetical protein KC323_g6691 [Hortaea werneckii]
MYSDVRQLLTPVKHMKDDFPNSMDENRQKIVGLSRRLGESSHLFLSELSEHSATHSLELEQIRNAIEAMQIRGSEILQKDAILQRLHFPQFCERKREIKQAHADTFEWIYKQRSTGFKDWLCEENGIFWISGKAGSGKSTLMKFLARHPMTKTLLKQWTGDNRLVLADFYFWSTGHPLEKTQEGLLRSLLFQLLQECHELIPSVCATRWKPQYIPGGFQDSWQCSELIATINAVLAHPDLSVRFCLFIDGMDEYQGDQGNFVQDLMGFSKHSSVKICASSRPWTLFKKSFGIKPGQYLTLEGLTKGDIDRVINDELIRDDRFTKLGPSDGTADELTDELRKRADGVFLWVFIVVRSLLRGVDSGDDMATLRKRLNETPSDLEDLFRKMLFGPDNVYRTVGARALQLSCHADQFLDPILFCFLQQDLDNPSFALQHHERVLRPWSASTEGSKQLDKWFHGLLETHMQIESLDMMPLYLYGVNWSYRRFFKVRFLHRTVRDFLTTSDIQSTLSILAGQDFNPWSTLCRLSLIAAKCISIKVSPTPKEALYRDAVWAVQRLSFLAFYYARKLELTQNTTEYAVLQEFDTVFESLARAMKLQNVKTTDGLNARSKALLGSSTSSQSVDSGKSHDDRSARRDSLLLSSAALGAQFNLQIFLLESIRKHGSHNPQRGITTLIYHALFPFEVTIPLLDLDEYPSLDTVRFLKKQGCASRLFVNDGGGWSKYQIHRLLFDTFERIKDSLVTVNYLDYNMYAIHKEAARKGRMERIAEILTTSSENVAVSTRTVPPSHTVIIEWLKACLSLRLIRNSFSGLRPKLNSWLAATKSQPFTILAALVAYMAVRLTCLELAAVESRSFTILAALVVACIAVLVIYLQLTGGADSFRKGDERGS